LQTFCGTTSSDVLPCVVGILSTFISISIGCTSWIEIMWLFKLSFPWKCFPHIRQRVFLTFPFSGEYSFGDDILMFCMKKFVSKEKKKSNAWAKRKKILTKRNWLSLQALSFSPKFTKTILNFLSTITWLHLENNFSNFNKIDYQKWRRGKKSYTKLFLSALKTVWPPRNLKCKWT